MTQKRRKADSGKAIGEMTALRWEPTHVTKPSPRVVPLQQPTIVSQTSFGHISTNSSMILTVLMATESP